MSKETELIESLKKINLGREDIMKKLVEDFAKEVQSYLDRNGWDKTFQWVKEQMNKMGGNSTLSARLRHLYSQAYGKMWKLNKGDKQ